ncbi:unnamed protein product [Musa acuminata subsp. malaccensis]|uniref:(wild Malaysian banana) hypothetical protein n=1 Tax=Musa acuminata subsp. malaccensis TaxID=214687 RepID=A0A804INI6_MUSAM|nr:PREDICTED: bZIP transcription factor 11-like [Musa acuminata subsp. malaccensis]CAG1841858.1 unnamed protein product [Musa acuminata subsp. malaccensis]
MASPGGTSSGSSLLQTSGSYEDLQAVAMEQKKRKRMISNRKSARLSRMRKQKHLDDLTAEANQLRKENGRLLTSVIFTTQQHVAVEAENSVLRTRMVELTDRLQSLDEILFCFQRTPSDPWSFGFVNQSVMASADNLFQYRQLRIQNEVLMATKTASSSLHCLLELETVRTEECAHLNH